MRTRSILLSLLAAVLTSTAAWATTLSPTLDVLYRAKNDKTHFEKWDNKDTPRKSDDKDVFECKWSANLFAIQRYEIENFATAKTLTLTLSLGATGANNHAAVWNFPYEMPEAVSYDATKRAQFFTNVESVTGVTIHTSEGSFANQLAISSCSENTLGTGKWTFTIDAGGLKPAGYTEDGKAIIQLLITSNAPNASGQVKYYTNSSNDASLRPKLDVTYGTGNLQNPITEINYRFNTSSQWNDSNFPKLGESTASVECNYSGRLFVVEQFAIENYSPEKIYTLTLTKNGANNSISIWDFPYETPIQKDNAVCPSVIANIQNVTGATITEDPVVAPSTTPIQSKNTNSSAQWVFTIAGYQLTPISWSGTTARVSILLTGPSNSKYYSIQGENKPTLVQSGIYPVVNLTQTTYLSNLADAVSAANTNDVLELKSDVTISSRLDVKKNITIQGATGDEKLICGVAANTIMILVNPTENNITTTIRNLVADGNGASNRSNTLFETNEKGNMVLENIRVQNIGYAATNKADIKNSNGNITLKGNNSFPAGIALNSGKRIEAKDATHTTPIRLILANNYAENFAVVKDCNDPSLYYAIDEAGLVDWELYHAVSGSTHELKGRKIAIVTLNDGEDNSTTLSTNDGKQANVTINRSITRNGTDYATFCVPFAIDAETIAEKFGEGAEILKYSDTEISGETATFYFTEENEIEAGVPYLIKPTAGSTITSMTFEGVTIDKTERPSADANYEFIPVFSQANDIANSTDETNHSVIYLGAGNQLYYAADGADMKGFRAYFRKVGSSPAPTRRLVFGRIKDQTTGVADVQGNNVQCTKLLRDGQLVIVRDGVEYNAMGQMVK